MPQARRKLLAAKDLQFSAPPPSKAARRHDLSGETHLSPSAARVSFFPRDFLGVLAVCRRKSLFDKGLHSCRFPGRSPPGACRRASESRGSRGREPGCWAGRTCAASARAPERACPTQPPRQSHSRAKVTAVCSTKKAGPVAGERRPQRRALLATRADHPGASDTQPIRILRLPKSRRLRKSLSHRTYQLPEPISSRVFGPSSRTRVGPPGIGSWAGFLRKSGVSGGGKGRKGKRGKGLASESPWRNKTPILRAGQPTRSGETASSPDLRVESDRTFGGASHHAVECCTEYGCLILLLWASPWRSGCAAPPSMEGDVFRTCRNLPTNPKIVPFQRKLSRRLSQPGCSPPDSGKPTKNPEGPHIAGCVPLVECRHLGSRPTPIPAQMGQRKRRIPNERNAI